MKNDIYLHISLSNLESLKLQVLYCRGSQKAVPELAAIALFDNLLKYQFLGITSDLQNEMLGGARPPKELFKTSSSSDWNLYLSLRTTNATLF